VAVVRRLEGWQSDEHEEDDSRYGHLSLSGRGCHGMTVRTYAPGVGWMLRQLVKIPLRLRAALAIVLLGASWAITMYINHKGLLGFVALCALPAFSPSRPYSLRPRICNRRSVASSSQRSLHPVICASMFANARDLLITRWWSRFDW
jgi:hypothetical protein